jgi:hypothetical protein
MADASFLQVRAPGGKLKVRDEAKPFMRSLKLIGMTIIHLIKQVCLLPQTIAKALQQKRQLSVKEEAEAERLDRLRNPSKYLGK